MDVRSKSMRDFDIDNAWDCDSIDRILGEIAIAEIYPDFGGDIQKAKEILEERRTDLGCE